MRFLAFLLLAACNPPIPEGPDDTAAPDDTGDTAAPAEATYTWVMVDLEVANASDSVDLDGDGTKDNALSSVAETVDPLLVVALAASTRAQLVQLADVADLVEDEAVAFAAFGVDDPDGSANNTSGQETYQGGPAVDEEGRARDTIPTALVGGKFQAQLSAPGIVLGDVELSAATDLFIAGTPTESHHDLLVSFGIRVEALEQLAGEKGGPVVEGLADLDTNGDGEMDAISAAFAMAARSCFVE